MLSKADGRGTQRYAMPARQGHPDTTRNSCDKASLRRLSPSEARFL